MPEPLSSAPLPQRSRLRSSTERYGLVARALHWLIAATILGALVSGFVADAADDRAATITALQAHLTFGLTGVVLTLVRISWWTVADKRPAPSPAGRRFHWAARTTHVLLYAIPLAMGVTGIGMIALTGAADQIVAGAPGPLPSFEETEPRAGHGIGALVLIGLIVLHIAAALFHQFVLRDRLLSRMGIGQRK